jgi:hypothetical protein
MGERMSGGPSRWFLKLPQLGVKIVVEPLSKKAIWRICSTSEIAGLASGVRAAAKAAERFLCDRARLTLKLASRKL